MYEPLPTPLIDHITADLPLLGEVDGVRYYRLDLVVRMTPHHRTVYCLLRDWQQTAAGKIVTLQQIIDAQQQQLERLGERSNVADLANVKLAELTASAVLLRADLANLQRQLAAKEAIIADLSAQLLPSETTDPQPEPLPFEVPPPAPALAPTPSADPPASALESARPYPCRYCSDTLATKAGRAGHEWRRHGKRAADAGAPAPEPPAPEPPTSEPPAKVLLLPTVEPRFVCADCGSDAFTASVRDPAICIRCAQTPAQVAA